MQKIAGQNQIISLLTPDENKRFTEAVKLSFLYLRAKKQDRSAESVLERIQGFRGNEWMEKISLEEVDAKITELARKGAFKIKDDMDGYSSYGTGYEDIFDDYVFRGHGSSADRSAPTHSTVYMTGDECNEFVTVMKKIHRELIEQGTEYDFTHVQQSINLKIGQQRCGKWMKYIDPQDLKAAVGTMKNGTVLTYKNRAPKLIVPITGKAAPASHLRP
jgi:hypothetical protein